MPLRATAFRLDEDLIRRVDEARGDVSRTRWVQRALENALGQRRGTDAPTPAKKFPVTGDAVDWAWDRQQKLNKGRGG